MTTEQKDHRQSTPVLIGIHPLFDIVSVCTHQREGDQYYTVIKNGQAVQTPVSRQTMGLFTPVLLYGMN